MRKVVLIFTCLILFSLTGGCVSKNVSPSNLASQEQQMEVPAVTYDPNISYIPSDVVANYFYALQEGNIEVAKKYLSKEALLKQTDDFLKSFGNEIKNYNLQINFEKEAGNFAKVDYIFSGIDQEGFKNDTMYLVLENDKWKIILEQPTPNPFESE